MAGNMRQQRGNAAPDKRADRPAGLQFIVSTTVQKPDPELRKFIRSHVMIGKNKGRILKKKSPVGEQDHVATESGTLPVVPLNFNPNGLSNDIFPASVPPKFGSDLCSIRFAAPVEPDTVEVVLQFSLVAKHALFALEPCMHFDWRPEMWIAPLASDPVFLHTMIFTSQYYFKTILAGRQFVSPHYLKALTALRERMAHGNHQDKLSFYTIGSVMGLCGQAHMIGDFKTAKNHLEGLHKIIELRGGVESFRANPKLLVEILRCDLGMAMHKGSRPIFLDDFAFSQPFPDLTPLRSSQELIDMSEGICPVVENNELARVWTFMSEFCCLVNFATKSGTLLTVDIFLGCITSVMYRLINMRFRKDSVDEAVRLGIMAFSSSVFLQWKNVGMPYLHLESCYRTCIGQLDPSRAPPNLMIWLLMVGVISLMGIKDEAWLVASLRARVASIRVKRWDAMRTLLKSFMWIDLVHDQDGRRIFDSIFA